ncbi:TPA: hypothetical protein ACH3X1_015537 [Trebouxia sp. C0004]
MSAGGHVARVRQQFEAANALPSPSARATVSTPQVPAAKNAPKATGRKRKARQQPAATATASPAASGSTLAGPPGGPAPAKPSFADVVAGRTTPEQTVSALVGEIQRLTVEVGQARAFGNKTYDQEKQSNAEQLERLHRHSKRNNLVVFGVPESMALNTPAALARHMQGLLFQTATSSELTMVRSAFRPGKWRQDQGKPRAVLVELLSVAAKHIAFQASKRLRDLKVRLDEDLNPQQMKTPRGLSTNFQCLKFRGYKPFFTGVTLRYRDGALIRKCARGEAKVVAAAAQAAKATAPQPHRQQQAQELHATVAMDPSALLHQHGISPDQLSDPSSLVAQAAQAIIADFDNMMCACDDASYDVAN